MSRRAAILAAALFVLLAATTAPITADHGGRDISSLFRCDRPVIPPRCTSVGDGARHHVALDASVPASMAAAVRRAMDDVYDPTDLTMVEDARVTGRTDVIVFAGDYGENGAAGWVYCPSDAPQGVNPSGDRWCRHQELHLNLNPRYAVFFGDEASRNHVACHELGHTVGLRHWGNPPQTSGSQVGATCMNSNTPDGPTELHAFDVDHINDYDYRQSPPARHRPLDDASPRPRARPAAGAGVLESTQVERLPADLGQLLDLADVVVRGEVVAVGPGRSFGPDASRLHYAAATVRVDEVIAGRVPAPDGSSLTVEIPLFDGQASIGDLPAWGEAVFVLRNKATSAATAGLPADRVADESAFHRLLTFTTIVVNDGGRAVTSEDAGPLAGLRGLAWDAALERLRAAD
jgi:hypothetical protein